MALNRITRGGPARRALSLVAVAALVTVAFAACGSGGSTTTTVSDKAGDAEILNNVLARELAAIRAYERTIPLLRGPALRTAREFRADEQEHVNAVVKALRGLGEKATPEEEEIESEGLKTRADALGFLYEVESVSIANGLRAISHLTAPWPRSLLGSIAANQAQHLVVLRQLLGADSAELIPEAFEDGTTPAPSEMMAE
ncbi:MAG TPA: ferritin-like domain-containing protein [Solirubrobacterales bacterium]|nr:ferritin-like domain-containing protein [Solirubrobacterales bacterium]